MKRLSVIIPGYNTREEWWARCLSSVAASLGDNDEIICIDDCSFRAPHAVKEFATKDHRILVRRLDKNSGLSAARNEGIKLANGKYVTFVDSDDEVQQGCYDVAINMLESNKYEVALFGVRTVWVKERLYKEDSIPAKEIGVPKPQNIRQLSDRGLLNYAWNKVYSMDFIRKHNLSFDSDGMPCEDIIFNLSTILLGARWCVVGKIGYVYYRTSNTLLSSKTSINQTGLIHGVEAWDKYKEVYPEAVELLKDHGVLQNVSRKWSIVKLLLSKVYRLATPIRRRRIKKRFPNARDLREGVSQI